MLLIPSEASNVRFKHINEFPMSLDLNNTHNNGADKTSVSSPTGPHLAILFHRLGPYHHARLGAAAARMKVTGVEFSNIDPMYRWNPLSGANGFNRVTLFSGEAVRDLSASRILNRVGEVLDQISPQVVAIPGWSDRCSLAALWWCGSRGIPVVVMSETTVWDFERKWLKENLKRRLIRLCAAGLVGGRAHVEYLEQLGLDRAKIFLGYDTVDNDYFAARTAAIRSQVSGLRRRHELPEKYFLASARFVEKKNLSRLIRAYAGYRELAAKAKNGSGKEGAWDLVLLGDGPLRESIRQQITALRLERHVLLHGFKQYADLPVYYGLAKVFIHASTTEQWGLVVNEAMASGLPVLVSKRCGCAMDLVREGVTGYSFDPFNVDQMTELMLHCSIQSTDLRSMGAASEKLVAQWGVERFADGLNQAADMAMKTVPPKASLLDWLQINLLLRHKDRVST
jgi:1,2-diacylglycerol 3-alpha-glucosyltransferase